MHHILPTNIGQPLNTTVSQQIQSLPPNMRKHIRLLTRQYEITEIRQDPPENTRHIHKDKPILITYIDRTTNKLFIRDIQDFIIKK
jgi:hypothetical protein